MNNFSIRGLKVLKIQLLLIVVLGFNISCDKKENDSKTKGHKVQNSMTKESSQNDENNGGESENVTYDRYWNDLARFLSGQEPLPGSTLDSMDYRPEAVEHRKFFKSQLEKEVGDRLKRLEKWAETELGKDRNSQQNVIYPFSGADFLHISTIYPNGKTYTLYGLEPEGNIPDIRGLHYSRLAPNLNNIQSILSKNFNLSFFRTSDMGREFNATELSGTTPILMLFMSMKGYEVLDVNRVMVNRKSELIKLRTDGIPKQTTKDSTITGVEIKFRKDENSPVQSLRYFSYDAQDIYLKNQTYLLNFFAKSKPALAYFKSASYLMHWNTYSLIRNNILEASDLIVQDDTGIAYRFYDKKNWNFALYGKYIPPISEFTGQYQKDLAAAFNGKDVKPLDFGLGYHNDLGTSNLIVAKKNK